MVNILAIGGHYDDIELGCSGSLCRWKSEGHSVYSMVVTTSDYQAYDGTVIRSKEQAATEGKRAAQILQIHQLPCLNYQAKQVQYNEQLIEDLNCDIDTYNIDTILTHWQHDIHQDHSAISLATLTAGRHCPRILMYRSNWYPTLYPFNGNFFVDISSFMDIKLESIAAHTSELERRGRAWTDFILHQDHNNGLVIGVQYAEAFSVVKWLV